MQIEYNCKPNHFRLFYSKIPLYSLIKIKFEKQKAFFAIKIKRDEFPRFINLNDFFAKKDLNFKNLEYIEEYDWDKSFYLLGDNPDYVEFKFSYHIGLVVFETDDGFLNLSTKRSKQLYKKIHKIINNKMNFEPNEIYDYADDISTCISVGCLKFNNTELQKFIKHLGPFLSCQKQL